MSDRVIKAWFGKRSAEAWDGLRWTALGLLLSQFVLTGCAVIKPEPEEQVKARVEGYWQAILGEDYAAAYEFLAPGFRLKIKEAVYRNRFVGLMTYHDAAVQSIACEGERCDVSVDTDYTFQGLPSFGFKIRERKVNEQLWIFSEGDWWLLPKK